MSLDELAAASAQIEELQRANVRLQRQLIQAKAKTAALVDAVELAARDAAVTVGRPTAPRVRPSRSKKSSETVIVHASDWQCGKHTESFNSEVLAQRISLLADKVATLVEIQRSDHPVDDAVLILGGDMVEGVSIFPGQAWEIDSTLYDQLFTCARITEQLIVDLLSIVPRVQVVAEYGNHGRLGRKGDHPGSDNIDLMCYRIVAERTQSDRVSWKYGPGWYQLLEHGNYRALVVHGDEVKSFGGQTPAFGIARKCNAWATGVVPGGWTDVWMGHWHQPLVIPMAHGQGRIFVNPSPESDNTYAKEFVAATGTPGQRVNFVSPQRGRVTAEYVVWLD